MADEIGGVLRELSGLLLRLRDETAETDRVEMLQEIERHNQLLETLIAKIGRS